MVYILLIHLIVGTGNDPANLSPLFKNLAKGGILRITGPDATRIIVGDPDVIKDIAIRKADSFTKPQIYDLLNIFGPNIVSLNDSPWKRHRVVADPAFAEDHMDFLSKSSYHCAQLAIDTMETKRKNNRLIIDAHSEMQLVTLDIIGKVS
jgi:cytochrome P450